MKKKNNNLVIGCDYDGVLSDMIGYYSKVGKKFFKKDIVNKDAYSLRLLFDVSKKDEMRFGFKYFFDYSKNADLMNGVDKVLISNKKKGDTLHAITARKFVTSDDYVGNKSKALVRDYAMSHGIEFDSFEFCSEEFSPRDKYLACSKLHVDVMYEDMSENAMYLAQRGICVALIDAPYNKGIKHKNIRRCKNFDEVSKYTEEIRSQKNSSNTKKVEVENLDKRIKLFKRLYKPLLFLTMTPIFTRVHGRENVPYQDGFIIASNHLASSDQYKIGYAVGKRYITGYASTTIENTLRGRIFKKCGSAIFIDRTSSKSREMGKDEFDKRVVNNYTTLVFPEGSRKNHYKETRDLEMLPFKMGAVSSSSKSGAPILPIAMVKKGLITNVYVGELMYIDKSKRLEDENKRLENIVLDMIRRS